MITNRVLRFPAASPSREAIDLQRDRREHASFLNGDSPAITKLWAQLDRVAPYFRAALITGEEGTGAELAAEALHRGSPHRERPMRRLDAAAAEAYFARGHFASVCVTFLEDVEALSPRGQAGLLRLLKMRGARQARVIASARRDLRSLVGGGAFSPELVNRLAGLRIAMPALRERREDMATILRAATVAINTSRLTELWDASFLEAAQAHAWPKNLNEVRDIIGWLAEHRAKSQWNHGDFDEACRACADDEKTSAGPVRMMRLEEMVQQHIRAVLSASFGNKQKAAEVLGISRSTLYRMLDAGTPCMLQKAS